MRGISKLGLSLNAKALREISPLSPNRVCCSGLNSDSIVYLISVWLGIVVLFRASSGTLIHQIGTFRNEIIIVKKEDVTKLQQFTAILVASLFILMKKN